MTYTQTKAIIERQQSEIKTLQDALAVAEQSREHYRRLAGVLEAENERLKSKVKAALGLISAQEEYVKLLSEELGEIMPFLAIRGWESTRVDHGKAARKKIENARKALEQ